MGVHACRANRPRALLLALLFGAVILSVPTEAQESSDWNPDDPVRRQALSAHENRRMFEAAVLLEKVVAQFPRDVGAQLILLLDKYEAPPAP